jgi:hypothetical protein
LASPFQRFTEFTRQVLVVPKAEIDKREKTLQQEAGKG